MKERETILIADDNQTSCCSVEKFLSEAGYGVISACNGREAVDLVKNNSISLVIMDVQMPVMDGIEAARIMRRNRDPLSLPIIFVSATFRDLASRIKALDLAASDHLREPFELDELLARVNAMMKARNLYRELRRTKDRVQQSEERYRDLFNNMNNVVAVYEARNRGKDFIFKDFNRAGEKIEKIKKEYLIGKSVLEVFPGVKEFGLFDVFQRVWKTGKSEHFPLTFYKDERIDGWRDNFVYKLPSGEVVAVYSDETERKQTEERLYESLHFLQELSDSISNPIFYKNAKGIYLGCNKAFESFAGISRKKIIGKTVYNLLDKDKADKATQDDRDLLRQGGHKEYEFSLVDASGSNRTIILSKSTFSRKDGTPGGVVGVLLDITERKKLEYELRHAQKMDAIGTLAGGIAHDFNNILSVIFGYSQLALDDIPKGTLCYKNVKEVLNSASRAKDLVSQILAFSRKTERDLEPIDLGNVIREALKLITATLPSTIEIRQDIQDTGSVVLADPIQIHQVMINLCTNASQAMSDKGGILYVKLEKTELDSDFAESHPWIQPGAHLHLEVSDTGHGMNQETVTRIFDPYFTTKKKGMGKGTGLSLSVVHGIIEAHKGIILVDSESEKGSTFHIYLPCMDITSIQADLNRPEPV